MVTLATGVSGFISYDFCRLTGRVPRPSFTFLFQGASMRCFVSLTIAYLFGAVRKGSPVSWAIWAATSRSNPGWHIKVATDGMLIY